MKKIYLLLSFLLAWLGGAEISSAQTSGVYDPDESSPLITSVEQLSSPYTETTEGSLEGMIDEDPSTYWHSSWSGGAVAAGTHYFQVELPDGEYDLLMFQFTRRDAADDQITLWGVYGTDDPEAAKAACTLLATIETPYRSGTMTINSTAFAPSGFKYLRFYCEDSQGANYGCRGYFHVAEFQLYPPIEVEPKEAALRELIETFTEYEDYLDASYPFGSMPGQYSEEAFEAFAQTMADAASADGNEELTADELLVLRDQIIATWEAFLATKAPMTLADGYYRIRAAMTYTNNIVVDQDEEGNDITEATEVNKYLYGTAVDDGKIAARWQTPRDLMADASCLWKVANRDGLFDIVNVDTEARFIEVPTSYPSWLAVESENLMALDPVTTTEEGVTYVNIRLSTDGLGEYHYVHQGGHGGGTNVSGDIVGWECTYSNDNPGASEWVFEPVSDEDAAIIIEAWQPVKDHDLLVERYTEILNDAKVKLETAIDTKTVNLVTQATQFSSPFSEASEGSIAALLDGDTGTYWHSSWSGGAVEQHYHYLQIDLGEPTHELVRYAFARRTGAASDHTTQWSIYGGDDPDGENDAYEELMKWSTPFGSNTESFTSDPFDTKGHQYLRIFSDATTNNRGYWHISEARIFYLQENPQSQYVALGTIAANLMDVIMAQLDVKMAELTIDHYNALKDAYDAFIARFVDPAPLREAIDVAQAKADGVAVGTQPGYWRDDTTAKTLTATIDAAKAYDTAGAYTADQSTAYITTLQAQEEAIDAAVIGIRTDKWYRIRFATEEEFTAGGWDLVAGNGYTKTDEETGETFWRIEPLWGKYITVAEYEELKNGAQTHRAPTNLEPTTMGHQLYLDAADDIEDATLAQFRFIAVGDTAYAIQHRATGMFIRAGGTTGPVSLSAGITLFDVRAIGYGQNVFPGRTLGGVAQNYLHAQVSNNVLVTWGPGFIATPGTRSGLYIEEVEDVAADYDGTDFLIPLNQGSVSAFCFPEAVEATTEDALLYGVAEVADNQVTLVPITGTVNAGRPFICIVGNPEDYNSDEDAEPMAFKHAYDFTHDAIQTPTLKGTFAPKTVGAGVIVAAGNKFAVTTANSTVAANSAYISGDEAYDTAATITFTIDGGEDGIAAALSNVVRAGELYTIDGRLLSRRATLGDLSRYGKGIYILGGTKVTVK